MTTAATGAPSRDLLVVDRISKHFGGHQA
ncbi:MAG: hypothetical protein JWQ88_1977, partial [Rhodoferax sp.]|nr:hypothetical protein [Rhodoferax sp.]